MGIVSLGRLWHCCTLTLRTMNVLRLLYSFVPAACLYGHWFSWPWVLKVYACHVTRFLRSIGVLAMQRTLTLDSSTCLAFGEEHDLTRPCVDCGLFTGRFCDWCLGSDRVPSQSWCDGQHTPLCSRCDNRWDACHFCRGVLWCTPPAWGPASQEVRAAETARHCKRRS